MHSWEVNQASAPVDEDALKQEALAALSDGRESSFPYSSGTPDLLVSIISGPSAAILRPSQIEDESLADKLLQAALFGTDKIFDKSSGSENYIEGENLVIKQKDGENFIKLNPKGGLTFGVNLQNNPGHGYWGGVVITKEKLRDRLQKILRYAAFVLDIIDNTRRLTHFSLAVKFGREGSFTVQSEAEANRHSITVVLGSSYGQKKEPIQLTPAVRHRSSLVHDIDGICDDLITLLKRSLA